MRFVRPLAAALIATTALSAVSSAAFSAPLRADAGLANAAPALAEGVQYRRWHGGHGGYGYRGHGYRHHHHHGGGAGAVIGGLAAGAIIGGAIAAGQANAAAQRNAAYCAQRYRSYDPASGTYLNRDGNRYPCP
ncbi:MAG: BA14K family protein [Pseudomonadota bacterium]|jgi:hypothetical protein